MSEESKRKPGRPKGSEGSAICWYTKKITGYNTVIEWEEVGRQWVVHRYVYVGKFNSLTEAKKAAHDGRFE